MSAYKQVLTLSRTRAELSTLAGLYEIQPTQKQFCASTKRYMYRDESDAFHDILDLDPTMTSAAGHVPYIGADTYRVAVDDDFTWSSGVLRLGSDTGHVYANANNGSLFQVADLRAANPRLLNNESRAFGDETDYHNRWYYIAKGTEAAPTTFAVTDTALSAYKERLWCRFGAGYVETNKLELITEANGTELDLFWKWSAQTTADAGIADLMELGIQNGLITTDINTYHRKTDSTAVWTYWHNVATGSADTDGMRVGLDADENAIIEIFEQDADMTLKTDSGDIYLDANYDVYIPSDSLSARLIINTASGIGNTNELVFERALGNDLDNPVAVTTGTVLGEINWDGYNSAGLGYFNGANIIATTTQDWGLGPVAGTKLEISNLSDAGTKQVRLALTNDGNVAISNGNLEIENDRTIVMGTTDYVTFTRTADGGLTITTVDAAGADADITLSPDGEFIVNSNASITGFLNLGDAQVRSILGGVMTPISSYTRINTEGGGATDDLDTITAQDEGTVIVIQNTNNGREVVCKDGTGNLLLAGDFTLSNLDDKMMLISYGGRWTEISRSDNAV